MHDCLICDRIDWIKRGENPYFVRETETGYVVIGDHQRFEGYTVFLCKEHATELFYLEEGFRLRFMAEMAKVAEAVAMAFHAEKMNYELLGAGRGVHMHWHLFPRRAGDTPTRGPVWQVSAAEMNACLPDEAKLTALKAALSEALDKVGL